MATLNKWTQFKEGTTITGAELNSVLAVTKDKSQIPEKIIKNKLMVTETAKILQTYDLINVWRPLTPSIQDYTFFSHTHKVSSRIDFILISSHLKDALKSAEIGPKLLLGHSWVNCN